MNNVISLKDHKNKILGDDMARLVNYLLCHAENFLSETALSMNLRVTKEATIITIKNEK